MLHDWLSGSFLLVRTGFDFFPLRVSRYHACKTERLELGRGGEGRESQTKGVKFEMQVGDA